jgi:hypothetical protein
MTCHHPGCVDAVVSSSLCLLPLPIIPGLPAPCFHPENSCSQQRLGSSSLSSPHHCGYAPWPHCSLSPPREQLLAAAVGLHRPVLPPTIRPTNSGEQRQWGSLFLPLILIVLPVSTLRAGAHSSGVGIGGAISCFISWGVAMWQGSSYLVVIPLPWAP